MFPARKSQNSRRQVPIRLYPETWKLAQHGRDCTQRLGEAMPEPQNAGQGDNGGANRSMAQRQGYQEEADRLAV
jgi:hypothetical protein